MSAIYYLMILYNNERERYYATVDWTISMVNDQWEQIPKTWQGLGIIGTLCLIVIFCIWVINRMITSQQRDNATDDTFTIKIAELISRMLDLLKIAIDTNSKLSMSVDGLTEQTRQNVVTLGNLATLTQGAITEMGIKSTANGERLVSLEATTKTVFTAIENQLGEMRQMTAEALNEIKETIMAHSTQSNGDIKRIEDLLTESLKKQREATDLLKAMAEKQIKALEGDSTATSDMPPITPDDTTHADKPVTPPDEK